MGSAPRGIRIPAVALKGRCPRPLDDGGTLALRRSRAHAAAAPLTARVMLTQQPRPAIRRETRCTGPSARRGACASLLPVAPMKDRMTPRTQQRTHRSGCHPPQCGPPVVRSSSAGHAACSSRSRPTATATGPCRSPGRWSRPEPTEWRWPPPRRPSLCATRASTTGILVMGPLYSLDQYEEMARQEVDFAVVSDHMADDAAEPQGLRPARRGSTSRSTAA